MSTGGIDPADFAESFRRLLDWVEHAADRRQTVFSEMLAEHFGAEPTQYPVTAESLSPVELPNLQLALDAYRGGEGVKQTSRSFHARRTVPERSGRRVAPCPAPRTP